MPMSKNAKLVGLGVQSVEKTSQLILKLPLSLGNRFQVILCIQYKHCIKTLYGMVRNLK